MKFEIIATEPFERKLKRLAKKYKSLKSDLFKLFEELEINPEMGSPIGKNCYKIRLSISSKGKGKSRGGRIISFVRVTKKTVYLIDIYDKSEQSKITDKELKLLLSLLES
ncbi:MAG TPA: type II toxin-antitoxin system RelE/ParE family toxin [Bacteroidia bacterium]|nr:type II toxin-antitoxin system RelE/ParE family toxin [Bacteroidia bacterium]